MLCSIYGRSKSIEDTEKLMISYLPSEGAEEETKYRISYAVHKVLESAQDKQSMIEQDQDQKLTQFIGIISLKPLDAHVLPLPDNLFPPTSPTTLTLEMGYSFLPSSWGHGYATESNSALFESFKRTPLSFWSPFSKLYIRAIVNPENLASQRVMDKIGMEKRGVYEWTGRAFLAGKWREKEGLLIYGTELVGWMANGIDEGRDVDEI